MRSLALRVATPDVEEVLDRVIPLAPHGVHELEFGEETELVLFGAEEELPGADQVSRLCGGLVREAFLGNAPNSWRDRRLETHRPLVIADRLSVRPEWAPPAPHGLIDLVLSDEGSFGSGAHPTTRACLELLESIEPRGALADLGCGSGVLAIAAALLGWSPVIAVDADPASVEAARANAARNESELDVRQLDLLADAPPGVETVVANVPLAIHQGIASRLGEPPARVIASGVSGEEAEGLVAAYRAAGLAVERRRLDSNWVAVLFEGSG